MRRFILGSLVLAISFAILLGCQGRTGQTTTPDANQPTETASDDNDPETDPPIPPTAKWDGSVTYRQGEIGLTLMKDLTAFQGSLEAAGTKSTIEEVRGYYERDTRLADFAQQRLFFAPAEEKWEPSKAETTQDMRRDPRVGAPAYMEIEGREPEERPVVVVRPEFVIKFKSGIDEQTIQEILARHGPYEKSPYVKGLYLVGAGSPSDALQLCRDYRKNEEQIEFAEPNLIRHLETRQPRATRPKLKMAGEPTDELFYDQWHLDNVGDHDGKEGADVRALEAWNITRGSKDVLIAVIDPKGIDIKHPDLKPNLRENEGEKGTDSDGNDKSTNKKDDDGNGYVDDVSGWNFATSSNNLRASQPFDAAMASPPESATRETRGSPAALEAHGTAVAGLAVASEGREGVVGLAPECQLLGITLGITDYDAAQAFYYADDQGAHVISCSWGYPIGTPATRLVEDAIREVATTGRGGRGCVVVFAMTNEKVDNASIPDISSHPDVIAVGRSTNKDRWGESGFGTEWSILAPSGVSAKCTGTSADLGTLEITTTDLPGAAGYNPGDTGQPCSCNDKATEITSDQSFSADPSNYTNCFGGTSAATPLVAGAAALCLSVRPHATAKQIREVLLSTATKIEPAVANYDAKGYSKTHGYGRLDAGWAVSLSKEKAPNDPTTVLTESQVRANLLQKLPALRDKLEQSTSVGDATQLIKDCEELIRMLGEL